MLLKSAAEAIRVLLTLTYPFSDYFLDASYTLYWGRTQPLPVVENEILLWSATELAERIRTKELSSEDVVRTYIERAIAVNPYINAVVGERYKDALKDAQEVDKMLASECKSAEQIAQETPLLGVPFTCKEALGVKGLAQTSGLVWAADHVAESDHENVAALRKAGAIPVTVTNVPELCMWWDSTNVVFKATKNPYDNARTPGGSTGGEAALITSAGAVIGLGSDIGGSIRTPCAFLGIYGHKPTNGIIPSRGTFPYDRMSSPNDKTGEFEVTGPMCRYVDDLPLLLNIIDTDNTLNLNQKVDFQNVKIYYMEQFPGILYSATRAVKDSIKKAVKHFEKEYSIKAVKIDLPELEYATEIWGCKNLEYNATSTSYLLTGGKGTINLRNEFIKSIFGYSNHTTPLLYYALISKDTKDDECYTFLEQFDSLKRNFTEIFEEDAVLLVPSHPQPAPPLIATIPYSPNIGYTAVFNILEFPVTQIPAGNYRKYPIGIQAVSGMMKDYLTIATAKELDQVFGGWKMAS